MNTVILEDGYSGNTEEFFVEPAQVDGTLVLLRLASEPWMTKWARMADLQAALTKQQG